MFDFMPHEGGGRVRSAGGEISPSGRKSGMGYAHANMSAAEMQKAIAEGTSAGLSSSRPALVFARVHPTQVHGLHGFAPVTLTPSRPRKL